MLYMVIEYFNAGAAPEIYRRARDRGRQLPPGPAADRAAQAELLSGQIQQELAQILDELRASDSALPFVERLRMRGLVPIFFDRPGDHVHRASSCPHRVGARLVCQDVRVHAL